MYEQQIHEDILYCMFYAAVAMLSLIACCYLLLRRANAIAPDVTPPLHLRHLTAAFFAAMTLSHIWYMPIVFLSSSEDILLSYLIGDAARPQAAALACLFDVVTARYRNGVVSCQSQ